LPAHSAPRPSDRDELLELVEQLLGAFFELRLAGQRLGLVNQTGGGTWGVLRAAASDPIGMAELARRRGVSRQYIQKIASSLVEQGYLTLVPNPGDRRSPLMTATRSGKAALAAMDRHLDQALAPLRPQFSARELASATRTIAKLRERLAGVDAE